MTHPDHQRRGITRALVDEVRRQGSRWGCQRLYLTSEPANQAAHAAWLALGFVNVEGDRLMDGVSVISTYKGPGAHRAVYECHIGS
jgi:GNAT superfamily N-acetyltransferase